MRNLALILFLGTLGVALFKPSEPTKPVVVDTKPIVPIPQPEPIGSDEPIIEEPQVEPEIQPAPAPTYRAKQKVWVRTGWRRGHWEWR